MAKPLNRRDITMIADKLLELKRQMDGGELEGTLSMRYRVEGAITALEFVLGVSTESVIELLLEKDAT
jgi:hypothetical protein